MNNNVFISCAVTGSGDTASKHPDLPKTPEQIAKSAIEAAKAGAAIAHIHVREEDGTPSRRLELYKEVVDRIRSSETDVILNLTTGMGGDLDLSLIHISEPTRPREISYAVFCLAFRLLLLHEYEQLQLLPLLLLLRI